MNSNNIYKIILLVLFIFAVSQLIRVWNTKYEHLDPALSWHQWANLAPLPSDEQRVDFYIKNDDRYNAENKYDPILVDPLISDPRLPCAEGACKHDWKTYQEPGANGTYADLLWHQTSPRMVLQDNCLHCDKFKEGTLLNTPDGIASDFTSAYSNSLYTVQGALSDQNMMNPNATLEAPTNYARELSNLGSGLPPMDSYQKLI